MLSIIVAVAQNNIIGGDNKLLWHIPEDLKRFKEITINHPILMGRKTFESLPKILPGRDHIVLTKDKNYKVDSDRVTVINDFQELLNKYTNSKEELFVIGGGEIYNLTYPYCNKIYLTKVKNKFKGDTYFPEIDYHNWQITYSSGAKFDRNNKLEFEFIDLIKK